jgi:hypothetical protein
VDEEESYFDADDDDGPTATTTAPSGPDTKDLEKNIHRTPRMLSLTQAQLLNGARVDGEKMLGVADLVGNDPSQLEDTTNVVASTATKIGELID